MLARIHPTKLLSVYSRIMNLVSYLLTKMFLGLQRGHSALALVVFGIKIEQIQRWSLEIYPVATIEAKKTIIKVCFDRNDSGAESVRCCLLTVQYLPAADAQYHQICNVNFRIGKQIPQIFYLKVAPQRKQRNRVVHRLMKNRSLSLSHCIS